VGKQSIDSLQILFLLAPALTTLCRSCLSSLSETWWTPRPSALWAPSSWSSCAPPGRCVPEHGGGGGRGGECERVGKKKHGKSFHFPDRAPHKRALHTRSHPTYATLHSHGWAGCRHFHGGHASTARGGGSKGRGGRCKGVHPISATHKNNAKKKKKKRPPGNCVTTPLYHVCACVRVYARGQTCLAIRLQHARWTPERAKRREPGLKGGREREGTPWWRKAMPGAWGCLPKTKYRTTTVLCVWARD
jgi:hypothetical protein